MRIYLLLITTVLLMTGQVHADVTGPGGRTVDCFCTDKSGERRELGNVTCLVVDGRAYMARCEMAQNVPFWRETGDECLSSELSYPQFTPEPQTLQN